MDNLNNVLRQMEAFGIELRQKPDDRSRIERFQPGKRMTIGKGGKFWAKFYLWHPRAGGSYITGAFGSYRSGEWEKVEQDFQELAEEERQRRAQQRAEQDRQAAAAREEEQRLAALHAADLWHEASKDGASPYLQRKGLEGEACRYLRDGTLVIPLLRYDLPREQALQAAQRILPSGKKLFTKGFSKPRCALRLGSVGEAALILMVEGYATGLTVRRALGHRLPVFVALDAGNLLHVAEMLRELYPRTWLLICADDDWRTVDRQTGRLSNPGRTAAKHVAKQIACVDIVWPVFDPATRQEQDTDFDDLRQRQGLEVVGRQLAGAIAAMERVRG